MSICIFALKPGGEGLLQKRVIRKTNNAPFFTYMTRCPRLGTAALQLNGIGLTLVLGAGVASRMTAMSEFSRVFEW
jgi:hypothetical protein